MLSFEDSFEIGPAKTYAHFSYIDLALMIDFVLLRLMVWPYEIGDMHDDRSAIRTIALRASDEM
jgi:hypothetical protein